MIRALKKPTRILPRDTETGNSRQATSDKAKPGVGSHTSRNTAVLPSVRGLKTRRPNQKSSIESKASIHTSAEKRPASVNPSNRSPKATENFEAKVRSALSRSTPRRTKSSPPAAESPRSAKVDPAIIFCSYPAHKESSKQDARIQASLEAILKCQPSEQKALYHIIKALVKTDSENNEPDTKGETTKGTLNPRASAFHTISSLKHQPHPTVAATQGHVSTQHTPLKRRFHPRTSLDPNTFEPDPLQSENLSSVQTSMSKDFTNGISSIPVNRSNYQHQSLRSHSAPTLRTDVPVFENSLRLCVDESCTDGSIKYQSLHLVDPPDESGTGREALAIDPTWAQLILNSFMQKYPMTGAIAPGLAIIAQRQRNAEVQQMLEFIIMQKKEISAITGDLNTAPSMLKPKRHHGNTRHLANKEKQAEISRNSNLISVR